MVSPGSSGVGTVRGFEFSGSGRKTAVARQVEVESKLSETRKKFWNAMTTAERDRHFARASQAKDVFDDDYGSE